MATNFNSPTSDNLTGFQHDTSKNVNLRSASGSPLSHTALDQNWSRLGSAINNIHGFFAQRDSAINSLENSQLTLAELPVATSSVKGIASVDTTSQGGLIVTNGKIGINNTTLNSSIDARIASEIQADNSVDLSSVNSEWTWLTTPYTAQLIGTSGTSGGSNIMDPISIGWKFVPIIGVAGVPSSARQVIAHVTVNEINLYTYNPMVGGMFIYSAFSSNDSGTRGGNVILQAGSAPWPLCSHSPATEASSNTISSPSTSGGMTPANCAVVFFGRVPGDDHGGSHSSFKILAYR